MKWYYIHRVAVCRYFVTSKKKVVLQTKKKIVTNSIFS